jgi:hypothetical protein
MKKLYLLSILLLSACAGQFQGLEQPDKDGAVIYYYRQWNWTGAAVPLDVKENGTHIASLGVNEYKVHKTNVGKKNITTETIGESDFVPVNVEKGKSYFIRAERVWCIDIMGCVQIDLVPEEKALKEIQKCDKIN